MKRVHGDPFFSVYEDTDNDILIDVWHPNEDLNTDLFKELLILWKSLVEETGAKLILTNTVDFNLPMTPELQKWTAENITIPLSEETNYSKHAFVMPEEFIANLAIEQFVEETNKQAVRTKYFESEEEAKKWLLSEN